MGQQVRPDEGLLHSHQNDGMFTFYTRELRFDKKEL